jgi:glycosyltransferase involved in cell wall biosynthesis
MLSPVSASEQTDHASVANPRHLVLIGIDFVPRRATGDKNFWAAVLPELALGIDRISVISVRDEPEPHERLRIGACEVDIRYLPPAVAGSHGGGTMRGSRFLRWRGGSHPRLQGLIGKQLMTRRIAAALGEVLRGTAGAHVHLMDNFGPANHVLARAARSRGATASVTAIAYERRGRRTYDWFLRLSYRVRGLDVITMSTTYARKLRSLGLRRSRVTRIPWGVHPASTPGSPVPDAAAARGRLGVPLDRPLVLWAGFIQQIREPDFELAYDVATQARAAGLDATFLFAFKPETFRAAYADRHRPSNGIHVLPTPVDVFADARTAADVLFSPIEARDCIVAPPLTWIECMSTGIPVVSTDVAGADELIEDGRTGYRARDGADLAAKLRLACDRFPEMGAACRAKVAREYDLTAIGRAYREHWYGTAP